MPNLYTSIIVDYPPFVPKLPDDWSEKIQVHYRGLVKQYRGLDPIAVANECRIAIALHYEKAKYVSYLCEAMTNAVKTLARNTRRETKRIDAVFDELQKTSSGCDEVEPWEIASYNEMIRMMPPTVDLRFKGHTFEEMGASLGLSAVVVRQRFIREAKQWLERFDIGTPARKGRKCIR